MGSLFLKGCPVTKRLLSTADGQMGLLAVTYLELLFQYPSTCWDLRLLIHIISSRTVHLLEWTAMKKSAWMWLEMDLIEDGLGLVMGKSKHPKYFYHYKVALSWFSTCLVVWNFICFPDSSKFYSDCFCLIFQLFCRGIDHWRCLLYCFHHWHSKTFFLWRTALY